MHSATSVCCGAVKNKDCQIAAEGLEPANVFTGSNFVVIEGGTVGGTQVADPELQTVIKAWQHLSDSARRMIAITVKEDMDRHHT